KQEIAEEKDAHARAKDGIAEVQGSAHLELGEADVDAIQIGNDIEDKQKRDQSPGGLTKNDTFGNRIQSLCPPFRLSHRLRTSTPSPLPIHLTPRPPSLQGKGGTRPETVVALIPGPSPCKGEGGREASMTSAHAGGQRASLGVARRRAVARQRQGPYPCRPWQSVERRPLQSAGLARRRSPGRAA